MSDELDLLKRRKLLELQRRMLAESARRERELRARAIDPVEFLRKHLVDRGDEVLDRALEQYPRVARLVAAQLARLIMAGRIDKVDGPTLYGIFRELGYPVRMETRIVYKSRGRVKTISELLREEG